LAGSQEKQPAHKKEQVLEWLSKKVRHRLFAQYDPADATAISGKNQYGTNSAA